MSEPCDICGNPILEGEARYGLRDSRHWDCHETKFGESAWKKLQKDMQASEDRFKNAIGNLRRALRDRR